MLASDLTSSSLFSRSPPLRPLHSFPTRRSSDLTQSRRRPARIHIRSGAASHLVDETHCVLQEVDLRSEAFEQTCLGRFAGRLSRSEEHTSELQSLRHLVCRLLLEKKKKEKKMRS